MKKLNLLWISALVFIALSMDVFAVPNSTFYGPISTPSTNPSDWFSQANSNQLGKIGCGYIGSTLIARCDNQSLFRNYSTDTHVRVDFSADQVNISGVLAGGGGGGENAQRVYTGGLSPLLGKGYCVDFQVTPRDIAGMNFFVGFSSTLNAVTSDGNIVGIGNVGSTTWTLWNGVTSVNTNQIVILNQKVNMTLCANQTTILSTIYFNNSNVLSATQALGIVVDPANLTIYAQSGGGFTGSGVNYEISNIFVYNQTGAPQATTAAPPAASTFIITSSDIYDSKTISNFTIRIINATANDWYNTTNGTITILNATNGIYNITINSTQDGGYFNRTYNNYNVSTTLASQIFQSLLNLYVNDTLTSSLVSSFSVTTNFTTTGVSGGYTLLYSKSGSNHILNISGSQYPIQELTYSINALENNTRYVNISPRFQFYLRREADNSIFDINGTNTTRLTIFCPSKNILIWFKNESSGDSAAAKVSTQENTSIDCPYTLLKMDVTYAGSSYFRSLIPAKSQQNVTWWLLDLNRDTGVQIIINLRDLTGDFSQGIMRVKTAIGANNENIIEEYFDISTSVVLYLLKDALYKIILINNEQTIEKQIGDLIADAAGTKTITAQDIKFIPDTILDNNVSWSYIFNVSANILRLQYLDSTKNTTYIRWRIYNGTNASAFQILTTFESVYVAGNFTSTTYTYNNVQFNRTYYTHLFVQHSGLSFNISEYKAFGERETYQYPGFTPKETKDIKHYGSAIFLSVWMLLFSARHLAIGLTSTLFWIITLKMVGYLLIGWIWVMVMGLVVFFAWIADYMKRN